MARLDRNDSCFHTRSREREIANTIHRLVPDELIGPAERSADDVGFVEDDGVFHRCTLDETARTKPLHLMHEPEGARTGKPRGKRSRRHTDANRLSSDTVVRKLDLYYWVESIARKRLIDGFAVYDSNRLRERENLRVTVERRKTGLPELIEKRSCASVQNRRLRSVHADHEVVDSESGNSREHMLDCVNRVVASAELRAPLAGADLVDDGGYRYRPGNVGAMQCDAVPRCRGRK